LHAKQTTKMAYPHKHIRFDWAIKRLLRNKANFVILEGFLSELLMEDLMIQEILESQSNKTTEYDKSNQVDILAKTTTGELILIEVQNEKEDDYFHRMNYGQAKLTTEYLFQGEKYGKIRKVYSVNIVYFGLGQGDDYVYKGTTEFVGMHHADKLQLSAKQKEIYPIKQVSDVFATYYLIKVNNFDESATAPLDEWIYFLKNSEIKDSFKAKGLSEAKERMRIDNLPEDEKLDYEQYIKHERIRESEIETAHSDGYVKAKHEFLPKIEEAEKQKEEAIQREKESKIKLALKMIKYQESTEDIMVETDLSFEEIEGLRIMEN